MLPSQVYIETKISAKPAHGRGVTAHCAERKKKGCRAPRVATLRRTLARWSVQLCCRAAFSLSPVLSARSQLSPARAVNPRKGGVKVVIWRSSPVSAGRQRAAAGRGKARSQPPKSASCKPRKGAQNAAFTQFGLPSAPLFAPAGGRLSAAPVGAAPCSGVRPAAAGRGCPCLFAASGKKPQSAGLQPTRKPVQSVNAAKLFRVSPAAHYVLLVRCQGSR